MFKFIAMFFHMLTNFTKSADNLASALEKTTATVTDRAESFRLEQAEENTQRLARIKALREHNEKNPEQFEF